MTKPLTTDLRHIDVRQLARKKLLAPGYRYAWEWKHHHTGEIKASIWIEVADAFITFRYKVSNRDQSCHIAQAVQLVTTPCNYGQQRVWFACPHCGRKAALLYLGFKLACRRCHKMAYEVQRESLLDRKCRKLDKVRERLGWEAGFLNGHGDKPTGMHWYTYEKLLTEHHRLEAPILAQLGKLCGLDAELANYL